MDPQSVPLDAFEAMVVDALDSLPDWVEVCARLEDVPHRVRTVLVHEVGHAMGMSEAELRELGWA